MRRTARRACAAFYLTVIINRPGPVPALAAEAAGPVCGPALVGRVCNVGVFPATVARQVCRPSASAYGRGIVSGYRRGISASRKFLTRAA